METGPQEHESSRAPHAIVAGRSALEPDNSASLARIAEYLPKLIVALNYLGGATEALARKLDDRH